ncbi:class I SAM-dependent methyltransferase [Bradyrhizobium sp. GCM10028915]|uniref:class I SAM-dependent methyltransferase n=1 Tax=Bradyrhizobium sp. GCM10028915 TaxID=3273385 RepID=UPI00361CB891
MSQPESNSLIKLHIGAFNCPVDGWLNTDITPHIMISKIPFAARLLYSAGKMTKERLSEHEQGIFRRLRYLDITKPLPFKDASVAAVFSSHVFEHLFIDEVYRLVNEIQRVLAPSGVCRVVVPDLEKIVAAFDADSPDQFIQDIYEVSKREAVKNSHHCGFTKASLVKMFKVAGFSKAEALSYQIGSCPDVKVLDNRPGSIFFEGTK